jgi:hypothetical protein
MTEKMTKLTIAEGMIKMYSINTSPTVLIFLELLNTILRLAPSTTKQKLGSGE